MQTASSRSSPTPKALPVSLTHSNILGQRLDLSSRFLNLGLSLALAPERRVGLLCRSDKFGNRHDVSMGHKE